MMTWFAPRGISALAYIGSELLAGSGSWPIDPTMTSDLDNFCCSRDSLDSKRGQH